MLKYAFMVAAAALPLLSAAPASAASIIECQGANCVSTDENVLLTNVTNQTMVSGFTNQTNTQVNFTSTGNTLNANNGQASLSASDMLLENLTVTLAAGATFQTAFFNLSPLSGNNITEALTVEIFSGAMSRTLSLSGSGNNFFAITADPGEQLTGFSFVTPTGTGIDSLRQLRFGEIANVAGAVPEPATWLMMLLGFGAIGFSMRRAQPTARVQFA